MTTINPQIDAAVPRMKARAAKFNKTKTMDPDVAPPFSTTFSHLATHAYRNIRSVVIKPVGDPVDSDAILDCMNLCALALSVLPKEGS